MNYSMIWIKSAGNIENRKQKGKATRGLLKDPTDYESLARDPHVYNVLTGVSS